VRDKDHPFTVTKVTDCESRTPHLCCSAVASGTAGKKLIPGIRMKTIIFILSAGLYLSLIGCTQQAETTVQQLNVAAFEQKMNSADDKIVLDVRTPAEFRQGHLAGATLIDVLESDFEAKAQKLDKSKPLFVYCASGIRSEQAAGILHRLGYRDIYELEGGFQEWENAGKPFVND
jgi:rhodanese-related sulfurtransferase